MDSSDKKELAWLAKLIADFRKAAPAYNPLVVGANAKQSKGNFS